MIHHMLRFIDPSTSIDYTYKTMDMCSVEFPLVAEQSSIILLYAIVCVAGPCYSFGPILLWFWNSYRAS
jgi:hypothetical protein